MNLNYISQLWRIYLWFHATMFFFSLYRKLKLPFSSSHQSSVTWHVDWSNLISCTCQIVWHKWDCWGYFQLQCNQKLILEAQPHFLIKKGRRSTTSTTIRWSKTSWGGLGKVMQDMFNFRKTGFKLMKMGLDKLELL